MAEHILAIDHGTTGTTALVMKVEGGGISILARGYAEFAQHFPQPGWVEHDLNEIWESVAKATRQSLEKANLNGTELAAIGITNQRETTGLWDGDKPVHNAIVWQDRRTAPECEALRAAGHLEVFQSRTGLVLDPYFSGTKVAWLLREEPELRSAAEKGSLRFGTMDTWLVWRLSGGKTHVSDVSNASRTLMFDIHKRQWDEELCSLLGDIPMGILPEVKSSSEVYGHTQGLDFLPDGIPIAGMAGDQQAALFGQACFTPGMAKCTYGTGAFALMNTGTVAKKSENGLLTTIAWQLGDEVFYALEGSTFIAGAVVQWLRDGLEFFKDSPEVEALAKSVEDTGGVVLVPALTGLGAPHWRPDARGLISGITRGTNRGHIARAALEGIAFQVAELLEAMAKDSGQNLSLLRVDGGASANELLMQFQADLLGIETHRPTILESTALGAAFLAGLGVGLFSDTQAVNESWSLDRTFSREMSQENVDRKMQEWRNAVGLA